MKKNIIFAIFLILITNSCGFKVVNKNQIYNFDINKIVATGDSRINYKIKNKLLFSSKKSEKKFVDIYINTAKSKIVKEKNIKNEVTKYEISVKSAVEVKEIIKKNTISFIVTKGGDYSVAKQYSQTLINEKNLIDLLTNDVAEEILEQLTLNLDDL